MIGLVTIPVLRVLFTATRIRPAPKALRQVGARIYETQTANSPNSLRTRTRQRRVLAKVHIAPYYADNPLAENVRSKTALDAY